MSGICQEVSLENFEQLFLEHSKQYPVLVVFWAPSFEESVDQLATVEQVAVKYQDKLIFSKIDCDQFPNLAQQFNVKSLPTVVLVKDGQPIDGFAEIAPAEKVALFIDKHLPKPWDIALAQALELIEQTQFEQALALLLPALEQSNQRNDIKMHVVHCMLETTKVVEAQAILNQVPYVEQDERFTKLKALLEVKLQTIDSPELEALKQTYESDIENIETLKTYAAKLAEVGRQEEALTVLYQFMQSNKQETQIRVLYLDVIKNSDAKTAAKFQRKLYTLLY
ncbi:tetratricopeptide repeat protein [Marinicellulosiphila megalodicopiae]|uniref:tetratricopeptide repeat protein n=1 Tax=Marinicellulosiphila megalodicopiae TaxID=2724896 RepID=UPI003BB1BEAA